MYDIRTALLPFMFIFNTNLLLIGVDSVWMAIWIFITTVLALFAFGALTQGFFFARNRWVDGVLLAVVVFALLRADLLGGQSIWGALWVRCAALGLLAMIASLQIVRSRCVKHQIVT